MGKPPKRIECFDISNFQGKETVASLVFFKGGEEVDQIVGAMPKPVFEDNGSGMHVHQSLFTLDGVNAFFDAGSPYQISDVGRAYIGGLLDHARSLVALTNPLVNSYKRLVPGYEAPTYLTWGRTNRSALIRVPKVSPGRSIEELGAAYEALPPAPPEIVELRGVHRPADRCPFELDRRRAVGQLDCELLQGRAQRDRLTRRRAHPPGRLQPPLRRQFRAHPHRHTPG